MQILISGNASTTSPDVTADGSDDDGDDDGGDLMIMVMMMMVVWLCWYPDAWVHLCPEMMLPTASCQNRLRMLPRPSIVTTWI